MENRITEQELEEMRLKAKKRLKIVLVLSFLSLPLYFWLFYQAMEQGDDTFILFIIKLIFVALVLGLATFGILWLIIAKRTYDKFNEAFKTKYVLETIGNIAGFDKLQYIPKGGFLWEEVKNAAVVNCGEKRHYESEDLLLGEYENIQFKISDVSTYKTVRRDKKNRVEEIFSGQIICLSKFDAMKESNGHLQIFESQIFSNLSGWTAEHHIQTESEVFDNRFNIYASDEHNAFYILTPQRMEKITHFADVVSGQVCLVFYDEKLFVAVKRESMFDASIDEPVSEQTGKIIEDAKLIQIAKEILVAQ